ncbi:conserved hypothetical protein [Burkholderia gladioli]|nr:conserved hypothetical protein [Burkholderia gladioli]
MHELSLTNTALADWHAWVITSIGAGLLWGRLGRTKVKAYVLSAWLDTFMRSDGFWRVTVEVVLFVGVGTFLALGLCSPSTFAQALGAGFGWTSLVAKQGR